MPAKGAAPLLEPAAMSKSGWITSILKTPFFCHKFKTRTILLCKVKQEGITARNIKAVLQLHNNKLSKTNLSKYPHPVLYWAEAEILKRSHNVFGESWPENILVCAKLMSGLSDDGIDHV